ncbi:MAG TPA: histidine triad nucleotide-binding protein [Gemmatimonadota bacterium]|nr:histidine triad nucleotide-binding protein [Gemmatimonadota bacterium]
MGQDCLFCAIAGGRTDADVVSETDRWLAIRDIDPQAPVHVLVIPREHVASLDDLEEAHRDLAGELLLAAREVARSEEIADGYRVVVNTGGRAGQTVHHLHVHVLGGRGMRWPPG